MQIEDSFDHCRLSAGTRWIQQDEIHRTNWIIPNQSVTVAVITRALTNPARCRFRRAKRAAAELASTPTTFLNRRANGKVNSPTPQ